MKTMELKINALARLCTAEKESDREAARAEILRLMQPGAALSADPEYLIRQIMLDLGTPENLVGHPYMVEAILLVVEDRAYIDNVTFGLYPQVAAKFDTTAARVERAMRHLIEVTWARSDMDTLSRHFGNTVHAWKGKPTNSEFIARIANEVLLQLRLAS